MRSSLKEKRKKRSILLPCFYGVGKLPIAVCWLVNLATLLGVIFFPYGKPVWKSDSWGDRKFYVVAPLYAIDSESKNAALSRFEFFRESAAPELISPEVERLAFRVLSEALSYGYLGDFGVISARSPFVLIKSPDGSITRVPKGKTLSSATLEAFILDKISAIGDDREKLKIMRWVKLFIQDDLRRVGESRVSVEPSMMKVRPEEIAGAVFYIAIVALLAGLSINRGRGPSSKFIANRYYTTLALGVTAIFAAYLMTAGNFFPSIPVALLVPVAFFSILITVLFGRRSAFVFSFYFSAVFFLASGFDALSGIYIVAVTTCSIFLAERGERRYQLFLAGVGLGVLQCVVLAIMAALTPTARFQPFHFILAFAAGPIQTILVMGISPLFELALNLPTRYRLLELSSINAPAIRRLQAAAPGTYSHTLNVAALAEPACRVVGANGLLARVGTYYHDIGKTDNPEFFVENQTGENRHDDMKAALSAAVIRNHLKNGVEKARELRLPREVIDIVEQHHGKSLIAFFFDKAQKEAEATGGEPPVEANYRYPGPWPRSKEAAIVLLADGVEAASHTLVKPTLCKIEKQVSAIIFKKVEMGALQECDLTMRDLELIKDSFVAALAGQYHARIEYPDQRKEERHGGDRVGDA